MPRTRVNGPRTRGNGLEVYDHAGKTSADVLKMGLRTANNLLKGAQHMMLDLSFNSSQNQAQSELTKLRYGILVYAQFTTKGFLQNTGKWAEIHRHRSILHKK